LPAHDLRTIGNQNQTTNRLIGDVDEYESVLKEVAKLQIRTISAILAWIVVALLIANFTFKSELIILISVAIVVIAILIYFLPRFKKTSPKNDAGV